MDLLAIKWWGIFFNSSGDGFAVPMFNSLKTCLESAEMISVPSFSASEIAAAVLPAAVAPTITNNSFTVTKVATARGTYSIRFAPSDFIRNLQQNHLK